MDEPSIIVIRRASGDRSISTRLWGRMSTSTPTTLPGPPSISRMDAENTSEPPRAIPVSTINEGRTLQMTSCTAIMS